MFRRPLPLILIALVLLALGGLLVLGAFPPDPPTAPVERVLPNERFQTR